MIPCEWKDGHKNTAVKRLRMCERGNDQVMGFQAGKIQLSHANYKQSNKLARYGVLKAYTFYSEARKRMVTQQDTRLEFTFSLLCCILQISINDSIVFRIICETAVVTRMPGVWSLCWSQRAGNKTHLTRRSKVTAIRWKSQWIYRSL